MLDILENKKVPTSQNDSNASYCTKIIKSSGKINFLEDDSKTIIRKFNAFRDWPGIFFEKNNLAIKIHGIKQLSTTLNANESTNFNFCSEGLVVKTASEALVITHLQFPGKNVITSQDAANSHAEFFAK